jgi:hypothetical protein
MMPRTLARKLCSNDRVPPLPSLAFVAKIAVLLPQGLRLRAEYRRGGRDITSSVVPWIAEGLIDTISGDDVPFLAKLVEEPAR